jgi:hypothetical protein
VPPSLSVHRHRHRHPRDVIDPKIITDPPTFMRPNTFIDTLQSEVVVADIQMLH